MEPPRQHAKKTSRTCSSEETSVYVPVGTKTPEELPDPPKLPFRRLRHALEQVVFAIPPHIQNLNEHSIRLHELRRKAQPSELRSEQLRASDAVRKLKQDLFELENLHRQVREEDQDLFRGTVASSLRDAIDVLLTAFMQLHADVMDGNTLCMPLEPAT